MNICLILCYGLFQETNHHYKAYLDNALSQINALQPDKLILAGGHTSKDYPDLSEAETVYAYIAKQDPQLVLKMLLETESLTTLQNLQNTATLIETEQLPMHSLHIFCDSIRVPKVFHLASQVFYEHIDEAVVYRSLLHQMTDQNLTFAQDCELTFEKITIHGINIHRQPEEMSQQIAATLIESAFIKYPELHAEVITIKKEKWGIT